MTLGKHRNRKQVHWESLGLGKCVQIECWTCPPGASVPLAREDPTPPELNAHHSEKIVTQFNQIVKKNNIVEHIWIWYQTSKHCHGRCTDTSPYQHPFSIHWINVNPSSWHLQVCKFLEWQLWLTKKQTKELKDAESPAGHFPIPVSGAQESTMVILSLVPWAQGSPGERTLFNISDSVTQIVKGENKAKWDVSEASSDCAKAIPNLS